MFEKGARVHFTEKKWFCLVHHLNYYWTTTIKTGIVNNLDSAGLGLIGFVKKLLNITVEIQFLPNQSCVKTFKPSRRN